MIGIYIKIIKQKINKNKTSNLVVFMVKLQQMKSGQFFVTIPRKLCKALDLKKGDNIEFKINSRGRLELVKE
jgi:DNA-binding Xre family transcriptional regulator